MSADQQALVSFGSQVRTLRLKHSMGQEALALKANIDRRTLGNIECGRSWPSMLVYFRIVQAISLTPAPFNPIPSPNPAKLIVPAFPPS